MNATADEQQRTIQVLKVDNGRLREQIEDLRRRLQTSERRLDDALHIARHGAQPTK